MTTNEIPEIEKSLSMRLLESDRVPDWLIRRQIRQLLAQRLKEEDKGDPESQQRHLMEMVRKLRESPIAIHTAEANTQHYEVPTEFYLKTLGKHLKYSSCYFDDLDISRAAQNLDAAEARMLALTCERAAIKDGDRILELGCGWGSLSLWMASHYPNSRITVVSNSRTQKAHIDGQAAARGLKNLEVVTCDVNALEFPASDKFDRVVSVEMFEHMRNYQTLLARIASWMNPQATLFVHIFTHHRYTYTFEVRDESDWMARYFFTGGIMPSDDLLHYFQRDLRLINHWQVDGRHYQLTSEAWLAKMDAHRDSLMPVMAQAYGAEQAVRWWVYWRVFFMSCAELFGYREGREWIVSHYLFEKP
jgi:cyclopropane-fatty-acyl-phospholipid synthase